MAMCKVAGFFEISGEDINSPRQSFICKALADPMFAHLVQATYALIGHEIAATADISRAMFAPARREDLPNLSDRIKAYAEIGAR